MLKRLLLPNRIDCFWAVVLILFCLAFLVGCVTVLPIRIWTFGNDRPLWVVVAFCLAAIGAVIGMGAASKRRCLWMFAACMVCQAFSLGIFYYFSTFPKQSKAFFGVDANAFVGSFYVNFSFNLFWSMLGLALNAPGVALAVWMVRFGPRGIRRFCVERMKMTRQRFLIYLTLVLVVLGMANNVLGMTVSNYGYIFVRGMGALVFCIGVIAAYLVFLQFPAWAVCRQKRVWLTGLSFLLPIAFTTASIIGMVMSSPTWQSPTILLLSSVLVGECLFLLALIGIADRTKLDRNVASPVASDAEGELVATDAVGEAHPNPALSRKTSRTWASLWIAAPLFLLAFVVSFPFRYDVSFLIEPSYYAERWVLARAMKKVPWQSDGQIRLERLTSAWNSKRKLNWNSMPVGISCVCEFDQTTAQNSMAQVPWADVGIVEIKNMQSSIDTKPLRFGDRSYGIRGGEITSQQLNDVLASCRNNGLELSDLELVDSKNKLKFPPTLQSLLLSFHRSGQLRKLLNAIDASSPPNSIFIRSKPDSNDWPAIVDASQLSRVQLDGGLPQTIPKTSGKSLRNIYSGGLIYNALTGLDSQQKNWLTNTGLWIEVNDWGFSRQTLGHQTVDELNMRAVQERQDRVQAYWDLVFAFPGRINTRYGVQIEMGQRQLGAVQAARSCHWVFGTSESDGITELFIPNREESAVYLSQFSEFANLETLSFDPQWLGQSIDNTNPTVTAMHGLAKFKKLKKLYLSEIKIPFSLYFLSGLQELKHLQVATDSNGILSGLSNCPSLESLTVFGMPGPEEIAVINTLPRLKSLTIVDTLWGLESKFQQSTFLKRFPGIKVIIVSKANYKPEVPESFKQHLARKSAELRAKLLEE